MGSESEEIGTEWRCEAPGVRRLELEWLRGTSASKLGGREEEEEEELVD